MGPKVGVRKVGKVLRPGGPKCAETWFLGIWHQNKKIIFGVDTFFDGTIFGFFALYSERAKKNFSLRKVGWSKK